MSKERFLWFLFYLAMLVGVYYLWYVVDDVLQKKSTTYIKETDSRLTSMVEESESRWERIERKKEHLLDMQIAEAEAKALRSEKK